MTRSQEENIGIVGAGALGKAIAAHLGRCSIRCAICNSRAPATLDKIAQSLGPSVRAATLEEAVAPEIVILALPWARVPEMLERVPDWEGRIVIDATNPFCTRHTAAFPEADCSPSERIVQLAPGAHIVMAFNCLPAELLARHPEETVGRRVIFYSGNHARAKRRVAALIFGLGFAPLDLGPLATGGHLLRSTNEALTTLNLVQLPIPASARP